MIFRWSTEGAQRLLELQAGTVDGITSPAPDDLAKISSPTRTLKLFPYSNPNIFYVGMNNTIKPFDSEAVRQAVAMAIDKQHIVDNFYPPGSVDRRAIHAILDFEPGYSTSGDGATWYKYDPAAAKAALAAAGFPNGFDVTLSFRNVVRTYLPQVSRWRRTSSRNWLRSASRSRSSKRTLGRSCSPCRPARSKCSCLAGVWIIPDATDFFDTHFTGD